MHLIAPLASGCNGAANGTAILVARGTTTPITYWLDFEATQQVTSTLSGVPLDANGSVVLYVNQLVDVKVLDVNGVQLREFVAGDNASAIEVISQSFTGTGYSDGSSGVGKPTTEQVIFDAWLTSAGAADFKVLQAGVAVTLQAAVAGLAGLLFNVKAYGAIGNGVADDGGAIQAAINAAQSSAGSGGVVFFPPGTYRSTTTPIVVPGVSLLGSGELTTKYAVDTNALSFAMSFQGADSAPRFVHGMWFGSTNQDFTGILCDISASGVAVTFGGCVFGGDTHTKAQHMRNAGTGFNSRITVQQCAFFQQSARPCVTNTTATNRMIVRDSTFIVQIVGVYGTAVLGLGEGVVVEDCVFDSASVTGGATHYIEAQPTALLGGVVVTGCLFNGNAAAPPVALFNVNAIPTVDFVERANTFGASDLGGAPCTAYGYNADGFAGASFMGDHGSRVSRNQTPVASNGNVTVFPKEHSEATITRNGAGAQVITAAEKGRMGDRFTLTINNNSGGVVAPTFGGLLTTRAGYVANIANTGIRVIEFMWLGDLSVSVNGIWLQVAVEAGG